MRENKYQSSLIRKLKLMFPNCLILKNDSQYLQGVPDILILYYGTWAALEVKRSLDAETQPNQAHYVEVMDRMSFASFICPENEEYVLNELQYTFGAVG